MAVKHYIGAFITLVVLTASLYLVLDDNLRLDIGKTHSTFKVLENGSWVVSGREYTLLYNGTRKLLAQERIVHFTIHPDNTTTIQRSAYFPNGVVATDTYYFDGNLNDVELFPVYHTVNVQNGKGLILSYEVTKLLYAGSTKNNIPSPQSFGRNMKIEWDGGNYYSQIFKYAGRDEGKLTVKYKVDTNDFTKNVRLFDPPSITSVILNSTNVQANNTIVNLTVHTTGQSADVGDFSYNWYVNGTPITILSVAPNNNDSVADGQTVFDFSGYNGHGELGYPARGDGNEPHFRTGGFCPQSGRGCYYFPPLAGAQGAQFINFSNRPQYNITEAFTIEAWVNVSSACQLVVTTVSTTDRGRFALGVVNEQPFSACSGTVETGRVEIAVINQTGTMSEYLGPKNVFLNRPYHLAVTWNVTNVLIFVNGTLVQTNTSIPGFRFLMTNVTAADALTIGNIGNTDSASNGTYGEVKIYNRTLTPQQIWQNYNLNASVIVSEETRKGQTWNVSVVPLNATGWNGTTMYSNNITILNSPPHNVTLIAPLNDSYFNYNSIFFNWGASVDNDTDGTTYFFWLNGTNRNATTNLNLTQILAEGAYDWTIAAGDGEANSTFADNRTFIIDTTQPRTVYISPTPANGTTLYTNTFVTNVSIFEANLANITFLIYNSTGIENSTFYALSNNITNTSIPYFNLAEGKYLYNVSVYDKAGNLNTTQTNTITIDAISNNICTANRLCNIIWQTISNQTINATQWFVIYFAGNDNRTGTHRAVNFTQFDATVNTTVIMNKTISRIHTYAQTVRNRNVRL